MNESEMAAWARMYANSDISTFPLWWIVDNHCACPNGWHPADHKDYCGRRNDGTISGSPGKHPIATVAPHGVKDATRDEATIAGWWARYPHANIGMPAGDNGLAIIDVDLDKEGAGHNYDRLHNYCQGKGVNLHNTQIQHTGGGGRHHIFAAPAGVHAGNCKDDNCGGCIRNGQGNKPPFGSSMKGIDTRGNGGYIVVAPSTHISGRTYEWENFLTEPAPWPALLSQVIEAAYRPAPATAVSEIGRARPVNQSERYAQAALERELEKLAGTGQGGRNAALNSAAYSLGQLVGAQLLDRGLVEQELHRVSMSIGLTEHETRASIRSGLGAGINKPRIIANRSAA